MDLDLPPHPRLLRIKEISEQDDRRIKNDYVEARRAWVAEIKKDAEKEYAMGDVEREVYEQFVNQLDHEVDYEATAPCSSRRRRAYSRGDYLYMARAYKILLWKPCHHNKPLLKEWQVPCKK